MYTIQFFINKFKAIPEENWTTKVYNSPDNTKHCALGHCGGSFGNYTDEAISLSRILNDNVPAINDGRVNRFRQSTPKERILAALFEKLMS